MKFITLSSLVFMTCATAVYAADEHSTEHHQQTTAPNQTAPLTEAGNDIFGTIQEVIVNLNASPNTDWTKVDMPALKMHLFDMRDMTINIEVVSQKALHNGSEILIRPTDERARQAMERILSAHPAQLKKEAKWEMQVQKKGLQYLLTTTTDKPEEVSKIIGLGYIGLMAYGRHHQAHHFSLATGGNPHSH